MKSCVKLAFLTVLSIAAVSCNDTNVFDPNAEKPGPEVPAKVANSFDFSTVQTVNLSVDYSSFKTYGQVEFSVYAENPYIVEGDDERLDENILPIYENLTGTDGKFSMNIELPAYAKHLYVVTGNFFVTDRMIEVNVENGVAKAVATNNMPAMTRADGYDSGEPTHDVSKLPWLSYLVNENGTVTKTEENRIYKDWLTPLGDWDSKSGHPRYVNKPNINANLLFSEEEMDGLYTAVSDALDSNGPCKPQYRDQPDLTLEEASEVSITMLGGSTCWNSSLGYYYYMDNQKPNNPKDLNIIMLFPNTQDGNWARMKSNYSYQGNIGVNRGDVVQLMYYPNIASGDLETDATTVFPKGIKIGFVLKTNGWGMQGPAYQIKGFTDADRKYNVWSTSTSGASYCLPFGTPGVAPYQYCNDNGQSRTAKFSYVKSADVKYAIVSFEDACNDQDYDDVIFALKPDKFTPMPEVEEKTTTTFGVYAFEDLWPSEGDYDMNDVVVDFKHRKTSNKKNTNDVYKLVQETFYFTTYQNYVELTSGLALTLDWKVKPSSIVMKKLAPDADEPEVVTFRKEPNSNVYYLTNDVKGEIGTTYILELYYKDGLTDFDKHASVKPFIYREVENNETWEVHIPFEAPTARMNTNLEDPACFFHKDSDLSIPAENKWFVRDSDYPFAFFLFGAKIESFKNTILLPANERKKIDTIYGGFLKWSTTKGAEEVNWYMM